MKYWFDTEFIEDGKTIDLLSIGIVSEDGRELYLENENADLNNASIWVREHVFPNMTWRAGENREDIAKMVQCFVAEGDMEDGWLGEAHRIPEPPTKPEFWAYYADYDWVVMCQLFGRMIDLPKGWPQYCRDFKQWLDMNGKPQLKKLPAHEAHNALVDAKWLRAEFDRLGAG